MKITACVIAKNEEKNIARCLSSVKPIASQLVVVDTGSTDNTVSIATELGADVFYFQWIDDFAAAKNYALTKAKGDWIIFLDADECLEESCLVKVKETIKRIGNREIDGILGTLINVDGDNSKIQTTIPSVRIFRNHPDLKFDGSIHESLKHRKRPMHLYDGCRDITILHLGYSQSEIERKDKGRRNLSLLLKELSRNPDDSALHFYLAETYSLMKEYELALFYALKVHSAHVVNQGKIMNGMEKNYFNTINYMRALNFPNEKIAEVIQEANRRFPNNPDFYVFMGDLYRHRKQFNDAIIMYEKAISLLEKDELSKVEIKTPSALRNIYKELADLYFAINNLPQTVRLLTEIIKTDRYDFTALYELMNILVQARTPEQELIGFFDKIYNTHDPKDLVFLLKAALHCAYLPLAQYYISILSQYSIQLTEEAHELAMLNGEYSVAADSFVRLHEQNPEKSPLLIKAIVSALLAEDDLLERRVLSYAVKCTGLSLISLIRVGKNENFTQKELEFLLEIIQELTRLGQFEPIRTLLNTYRERLLFPTAKLLYHLRNYEEAISLFDEFLKQNKEIEETLLADVLIMMADALLRQNEITEAQQYIRDAIALNIWDFRLYDTWIRIALSKEDVKELQEAVQKTLEVFPDSVYASSFLGVSGINQTTENEHEIPDPLLEMLDSPEYHANLYARAVKLTEEARDEEATYLFDFLKEFPESAGPAYFKLGEIANRAKKVMEAKTYHTKAFEKDPKLTQKLLQKDHPVYRYEYKPVEHEIAVVNCPLCHRRGTPYSCYNAITSIDFLAGFNPVRVWMYCDHCHHLFANNYPNNLGEILTNSAFDFNMNVKTQWFPILGNTIADLKKIARGNRLLEVGVGSGEMTSVAKEYLFDVTGVDIRPAYAQNISKMLNVPIHTVDFLQFESEHLFDVICMGDVIEHMADPVAAIKKTSQLLTEKGVLWISTPNFESAFSMVLKDRDPMWRIIEHLNYFSFRSLKLTLEANHFEVVDYKISARYNGSMEVTAIKTV